MLAIRSVIVLALVPCLAARRVDLAAIHGGDATTVQAQLTNALSADKERLGKAERRHDRALKKIRAKAGDDFSVEGKALGSAVANYNMELTAAQEKFAAVLRAVKAELNGMGESFDMMSRAGVNARISVGQRVLQSSKRTQAMKIQRAQDNSEQAIENEQDALASLWLGDLSEPLAEAKETLEAIAANVTTANATTAPAPKTALKKTNLKKTSTVSSMKSKVEAGEKELKAASAGALKKMDDAIAKTDKNSDDFVAVVKKTLSEAEKKADQFIAKR